MSLGQAWEQSMAGGTTQEEAFKFLDTYWEHGGNFIDTSNNYQDEQTEMIVGEWMKQRRNRDQIVLATKYTISYKSYGGDIKLKVNYQGNHRKSLVISVNDSLKKLQTDYIDVLYVHLWDYSTSIPEIMQALDALVKQNKVLYLGISDTPAWIVSKANEYARAHGMAQFAVFQGKWNVNLRDIEREILPMTRAEGMSIAPWAILAQGKYKTEAELKARDVLRYGVPQTEAQKTVCVALEKVAAEVGGGISLAAIAVAWALNKAPYVFPVIGGRSPQQLEEIIKAAEIVLTPAQMKALDDASPLYLGFPYEDFGTDPTFGDGKPNWFVEVAGVTKWVRSPLPITPGPP